MVYYLSATCLYRRYMLGKPYNLAVRSVMQPANLVLGTPKYLYATRGMPRLVGRVCMYIAKVGIHSFGVSFSVWFLVWCVVGLLAPEGGGREGVRGVWHGWCQGLLTSRAKNKTLLSEDCKKTTKSFTYTVSKRPLGGGGSRGEAVGSHSANLNTKQQRILLAPPTVHHNLWKVAVANILLADTSL
jgi:hypothetical protein